MRKLLLTLGAIAAWFLLGHIGLLAILIYVWASAMTTSTTNTAKARSTANRVSNLVTAVGATNTSVTNLTTAISGASTSTGQPAGQLSGGPAPGITSTSSAYPTGTTSGPSAGTAHTHDYGGHWHDMGNHGHAIMGHTHNLPSV